MNQPLSKDAAAKVVAEHVRSIARKSGREITRHLCNEVLTMMAATGASTTETTNEWLQNGIAPLADVDTVYQLAVFPPLPTLGPLVLDDAAWTYRSGTLAGGGVARLRVWTTLPGAGHLAMVTDARVGSSTTNSIEHIHTHLTARFGAPLWLLEHNLPGPFEPSDTIDQVVVVDGNPRWLRIWPTPSDDPRRADLDRWMRAHRLALLAGPTDGT